VFQALDDLAPVSVRALIVGQDPYPSPACATGRAFAVATGTPAPVSLRRILGAAGLEAGEHSDLTTWAACGVLLLNRCLTVDEGSPGSHRRRGWEEFTNAIVTALDAQPGPIVFLLWGNDAGEVEHLIKTDRHIVWKAPHPAARRGGFRERAGFRETNEALRAHGIDPIPWGPLA
jgi:uracil-DNA glycosylase